MRDALEAGKVSFTNAARLATAAEAAGAEAVQAERWGPQELTGGGAVG